MVTGIKIRAPGSQNFKIKKCKSAVSSPEKLNDLIFEGMKLKTAGNMYFYAKKLFQSGFWDILIFRVV